MTQVHQCGCYHCASARVEPISGLPEVLTRMIVCPICGNKRPRCEGCGNEIDLDTCGCGDCRKGHDTLWIGHSFVPMGCDCFRFAYSQNPHTTREMPIFIGFPGVYKTVALPLC